jgi:hypothetical protein
MSCLSVVDGGEVIYDSQNPTGYATSERKGGQEGGENAGNLAKMADMCLPEKKTRKRGR